VPPELAPMLVAIVLILTAGFIAVVRPIAKPLVRLFEAMIIEREQQPTKELGDIHQTLEQIEGRLHLMEERQSFYEALRAGPSPAQLAPPVRSPDPPNGAPGPTSESGEEPGGPSLVGDV